MENQIMSIALESGIWAALFCFLFVYMLKDSRSRENRYNDIIDSLSARLSEATKALGVCDDIKLSGESTLQVGYEIKSNTEQIKDDVQALRDKL